MNFSGVWRLPVVFVVNNNQWAISVPLRRQTASQTLAQKAIAAGFSGEQVDGNDVIAVRAAVDAAMAMARAGEGPSLIEAVTYRLGDHTTADDASRYRSADEVQEHWKEEPLARLRAYLVKCFNWNKAQEEEATSECNRRVDAAIERYLEIMHCVHPKPCSTISMPSCRASTPASVRKLRTRMPELTLVEAINLALARALTEDPNVVVFGEDVGVMVVYSARR